jgi:hypothetical protein
MRTGRLQDVRGSETDGSSRKFNEVPVLLLTSRNGVGRWLAQSSEKVVNGLENCCPKGLGIHVSFASGALINRGPRAFPSRFAKAPSRPVSVP